MYEILLTRIFSVTMWYHYAFMAISIAMFGLTFGSILVYVCKNYFREETAASRLALFSLLFGISILASFICYLAIPVSPSLEFEAMHQLIILGAAYLTIAVPFVLGGIVISLALTKFPKNISTLYAADLVGAALGCIALLYLLSQTTGPTLVVVISAIAVSAAFIFSNRSQKRLKSVSIAITIVLFGFGIWNGYKAKTDTAPLALRYVKGSLESGTLYEKWNSYSRITVWGNEHESVRPFGWGLSDRLSEGHSAKQLWLFIDSVAGTPLTKFSGDIAELAFLRYDIVNLAHHIRDDATVMVIGVGGGRDVLSGLAFDQKKIVGVEVNQAIIEAMTDTYGDFVGHIDRYPNVTIVNDEARSYISRSPETFDIIQISLIDTWAATAAGAFVLTENSLYTAEAWKTFLQHLKTDGILTVSRWYFRDRPGEMYRLTTLASRALRDIGVENPRDHILIARKMEVEPEVQGPDGVGTILVSRDPFSARDIAMMKRVSTDLGFEIVLTPSDALDRTFATLAENETFQAFIENYPINIAPPTDDNPFFFHMLRFKDFASPSQWELGKTSFNMKAVATLLILLIITIVVAIVFILLPLLLTVRVHKNSSVMPLVVYFAAIGVGFMLVEISLLQRLIVYLGHPVYSLSVVLFSLLLAGGVGSYTTRSLDSASLRSKGIRLLGILVLVVGVLGCVTPFIIHTFDDAPLFVRVLISVGIVSAMGITMGTAFPIGMKTASLSSPEFTPFLWGVNGAMSVVASVLAVVIAITAGISTTFLLGVAAYICALLAFRLASGERIRQ